MPRRWLAVLTVVACAAPLLRCAAVELQTTTYSMAFRVDKDEGFERAKKEADELLAFAKEKKMSSNMIMFLRTASKKVADTLEEFAKRQAEEAKAAAEKAKRAAKNTPAPPAVFTTVAGYTPDFNKDFGVKGLKSSGAKRKNVLRYRADEVKRLLKSGKINLARPFIVTDGVDRLAELRNIWTAQKLLKNEDARVRYLSPVKAKARRSFDKDKQQQNPNEEQMEYQMITMEKYFVNCFNLRGKPDFRRLGGAQTEHCEMTVPADTLTKNMTDYEFSAVSALSSSWMKLEKGRADFASRAASLQPLVDERMDLKSQLQQSSSHFFVFGSSGSGEQLRQEGRSFVDGLIHGKRRWFLMAPNDFVNLRKTANEILEPASAFMFFEQQMEELIEDHELGSPEMFFWEANQLPGDLIYIPDGLVMTSLAYTDSISYRQHVTEPSAIAQELHSNIWHPESGQVPGGFQFALCKGLDLDAAGRQLGKQVHPQMAAQVAQIMKQFFPGAKAQNHLIIGMLSECNAVMEARMSGTYCPAVWDSCVSQLKKNAQSMKLSVPDWLSQKKMPKEL